MVSINKSDFLRSRESVETGCGWSWLSAIPQPVRSLLLCFYINRSSSIECPCHSCHTLLLSLWLSRLCFANSSHTLDSKDERMTTNNIVCELFKRMWPKNSFDHLRTCTPRCQNQFILGEAIKISHWISSRRYRNEQMALYLNPWFMSW